MVDPNDPLYQDLYEGNLTENANGSEALWEILFILLALPVILILKIVRWIRGRR